MQTYQQHCKHLLILYGVIFVIFSLCFPCACAAVVCIGSDMSKASYGSILHPGKDCGPCKICQGSKSRYWHVGQAGPQHVQLTMNLRARGIEDADCICQNCQRQHRSDVCPPKRKLPEKNPCAVPKCAKEHTKIVKTDKNNFPSYILEMWDIHDVAEEDSSQFSLCKTHYSSLYNYTHRQKCCFCLSTGNLRKPVDVDLARKYASGVLQLEEHLVDVKSKVCNACFQGIHKFAKSQSYLHSVNSDEKVFASLVDNFRGCSIESCDSCESYAFAVSVVYLGTELLNERPVLLSTLHDKYKDAYHANVATFLSQLQCNATSPENEQPPPKSQKYLRTSVKVAFGDCITFSQISGQPRFGTMIRRTGSNVINSIHKLLFSLQQEQRQLGVGRAEEQQGQSSKSLNVDKIYHDQALTDVAQDLNKRLLATAKQIVGKDRVEGIKLDCFDFKEEVSRIDPVVWNFVTAITQGTNEQGKNLFKTEFDWHKHYEGETHSSQSVSYSKFLKRYLISSCLLFTTNEQCFTHLHMLLADVLDRYTKSSSACFSTLSKFGVTVSKSTYLRYQTKVSVHEMNDKVNIMNNSFCIASIDNIDRNFSYASVSSSKSGRGFHGTSVQAVEPLPLSTCISPPQSDNESTSAINIDRLLTSAPQNVPAAAVEQFHQTSTIFHNRDFTRRSRSQNPYSALSLSDFTLHENDKMSQTKLGQQVFLYMLVKSFCQDQFSDVVLPDLKNSFSCIIPSPEQSKAHFTSVLQAPADSQNTLLDVLDILHSKHQVGERTEHLVVAGDGKTFQLLLRLKRMYGEELAWMLPFIGDWHLLKNSQAPLLKVYLDAGLSDLLSLFHKGSTLRAVSKASGFQKTHQFLLQAWEAMYRHLLISFRDNMDENVEFKKITYDLKAFVSLLKQSTFPAIWTSDLADTAYQFHSKFLNFLSTVSETNATVQLWHNFVNRDMLNYFTLFFSIRSRDFTLRNVSVRLLAPIFHALDRPMYLRIVPEHLASLKLFPPEVLSNLQAGAFAVSISGQSMSCVALDEAHEMLINKDVKMAMTTSEPEGLSRLVHYLSHRTKIQKNLSRQQVLSTSNTDSETSTFKRTETNIRTYLAKLSTCKLFLQNESPLLRHLFSERSVSEAVTSDLLSFYDEGEQSLLAYFKCFVLHTSTETPKRRRRNLLTFAPKVKGKRKQQQELKDHKLQIACLRRQIAFSKSNNIAVSDFSQFVPLPRAICLPDGLPYKGNKAASSSLLQKCYPDAFKTSLSESLSRCFIIDSMFLINNTRPLDCHKTFADYVSFLYRRWVADTVTFLKAAEIHLVFDHPGRHGVTPKDIERIRRDKGKSNDETVTDIGSDTPTPPDWAKFLQNREQKRILVKYLCSEILSLASSASVCPSRLVVAGGFEGKDVDKAFQVVGEICQEAPNFHSNHEEADSRVWFHACQTTCTNVIIYSPDRDILHIGLPLMSTTLSNKCVTVQLSWKLHDNLYVDMNKLVSCFLTDLSFQCLKDQLSNISKFMQMLFICSGCDYVSYFKGQTKRIFLKAFQQHCAFITGGLFTGYLHEVHPNSWKNGLLSFYRLIGSVYFVTHAGGFTHDTPAELFTSVFTEGMTPLDHHIAFVGAIRDGHFHRINDEALWMPSAEALRLHWQRCCWTALLWEQSSSSAVCMPSILDHGWEIDDGGQLSVVWDTQENFSQISEKVKFLKEGCKCRTGCKNRRCKCVKRETPCGPGCSCAQCQNSSEKGTTADHGFGAVPVSLTENESIFSDDASEASEDYSSNDSDSDNSLMDSAEIGECPIDYDSDVDVYSDVDDVMEQ